MVDSRFKIKEIYQGKPCEQCFFMAFMATFDVNIHYIHYSITNESCNLLLLIMCHSSGLIFFWMNHLAILLRYGYRINVMITYSSSNFLISKTLTLSGYYITIILLYYCHIFTQKPNFFFSGRRSIKKKKINILVPYQVKGGLNVASII